MLFLVCLSFSLLLVLMVKFAYDELSPAKIFILFWVSQILFLIIGGYGFLLFKYTGVIYILICLFFFNLGPLSMNMGKISSNSCERNEFIYFNEGRLVSVLCLFIIVGFLSPVHTLLSHGFNLSSLLDFSSLLKINNTLAVSRYSGTLEDGNRFTQLLAVFSYSAPLIGGFTYPISSTLKSRIVCCASFLPLWFGGLTQGVKMGIIASFFLFISGLVVSRLLIGLSIRIKTKTLIYGVLSVILLIAILLLSMMFRIGKFDLDTFSEVRGKFIAYAFGHLPAFDNWFNNISWQPNSLTLGGKLFMGITNYLGILKREQGLFQDFQQISVDGAATNVYTVFRVLIDDFGVFLCPFFCLILGTFIHCSYLKLRRLVCYKINATICVAFLFFTFWSFATSVFVYTTFIIVFLLFYLVLVVSTKKI